MAKENERTVAEMKALADSFEKEVAEEGELEPSARAVARRAPGSRHCRPQTWSCTRNTTAPTCAYFMPEISVMGPSCARVEDGMHEGCWLGQAGLLGLLGTTGYGWRE